MVRIVTPGDQLCGRLLDLDLRCGLTLELVPAGGGGPDSASVAETAGSPEAEAGSHWKASWLSRTETRLRPLACPYEPAESCNDGTDWHVDGECLEASGGRGF